MRAYCPNLVDRLENDIRNAKGLRRSWAMLRLWTMRWAMRTALAIWIIGSALMPIAVFLTMPWQERPIESALNGFAAVVISGTVISLLVWMMRATK